ncbi:MAG TPA: hypothetical protein PKG88_00450 [Bacteroidales bacterium]|nr:hypothetical protein [Bacteroidales bacterium]HPS70742.1 hypothetical protein [Bacteroidales bacterium]
MTTLTRLLISLIPCIFNLPTYAQDSLKTDFSSTISAEQICLLSHLTEYSAVTNFLEHNLLNFHVGNHYTLEELTNLNLNYVLKWKENRFHFGMNHFGYSQFGLLDCKVGFSKIFNRKISFSLDFFYRFKHVVNVQSKNAITFSLSFYGKINNKMGMGFYLYNPIKSSYLESKLFKIPIIMKVLGIYAINKNMIITGELKKELPGYFDFIFSTLIHHKYLGFSFDFSSKNIGFGVYCHYKNIFLKTKYSYHYLLGGSPEMQLTYIWH